MKKFQKSLSDLHSETDFRMAQIRVLGFLEFGPLTIISRIRKQ